MLTSTIGTKVSGKSAWLESAAAERFWSKVDATGDCWIWTGAKTPGGYGNFGVWPKTAKAHRWAYEQVRGQIPDGLVLDHLCRNRACVNPDHLEPVTTRENLARGVGFIAVQIAQTACIRGHAFDRSNTYITPRGERRCRTCQSERSRRYYQARKAA